MNILGIDIGGTGIKGAPVNIRTGELLTERYRLLTPQPATPEAVAETVGLVSQFFDWHGPIGIGFPAVVRNGITLSAANVDSGWIGTNADALFEQATGNPVHVVNDADAAGLAEMRFGAGADRNGVVLIVTIGTGLGQIPNSGISKSEGRTQKPRLPKLPEFAMNCPGKNGRDASMYTCKRSKNSSRRM